MRRKRFPSERLCSSSSFVPSSAGTAAATAAAAAAEEGADAAGSGGGAWRGRNEGGSYAGTDKNAADQCGPGTGGELQLRKEIAFYETSQRY